MCLCTCLRLPWALIRTQEIELQSWISWIYTYFKHRGRSISLVWRLEKQYTFILLYNHRYSAFKSPSELLLRDFNAIVFCCVRCHVMCLWNWHLPRDQCYYFLPSDWSCKLISSGFVIPEYLKFLKDYGYFGGDIYKTTIYTHTQIRAGNQETHSRKYLSWPCLRILI